MTLKRVNTKMQSTGCLFMVDLVMSGINWLSGPWITKFTLIMCDGWFKYQDFSKYRLVWCQIVWHISWVVLFLLPSVIYTFILHSFYMNSQIALTWSIFVIYGHWPIIAYLVPDSCWETERNGNSISADVTDDAFENI